MDYSPNLITAETAAMSSVYVAMEKVMSFRRQFGWCRYCHHEDRARFESPPDVHFKFVEESLNIRPEETARLRTKLRARRSSLCTATRFSG